MQIKLELLKKPLSDMICSEIENIDIGAERLIDSSAVKLIGAVRAILCDENNTDFYAIEKIVRLFEENKIDCGGRHDF